MSIKGSIPEFEPLPMRRRSFAEQEANQYCIWTQSGEMKEIKADTAYEAVIKSGQIDIIKIERIFNSRQNILDRSKLSDDVPESEITAQTDTESVHDRITRRKNPIISAGEMNALMQELRKEAIVPQSDAGPLSSLSMQDQNVEPKKSLSTDFNPPPVPAPAETPIVPENVSAVGLDVHGDGFDEIIPAMPQSKPQAPKTHQEDIPAQASTIQSQETTPSRELSPEEVENLLHGKPE